ncbi:hypothetical protein SF1_42390 [Sphingobacterium faecium NBRC 15299]|uniref:hypothetical protein n=1 Tax=Sphingobacterium faecium TaxID=34087 RepID=UPI000D3743F8|nr:hypothetical protein [Sphingobacterium faecium]PTX10185.1 hypothetical protein C8N37_105193 [Sphingobacterium faecium]GEM66257.1 hypothetical protein SF1_42390 [Sphingobacterium faecium NBRC 15299]
MEIKPIFAESLYSFKYDNSFDHEYSKKMDNWEDFEHIYEKASENDIDESLIDQFFDEIFFDREYINNVIEECSITNKLFEVFTCLHNNTIKIKELEESKARFHIEKRKKLSQLRLYALRVSNQKFIITGGAIKFTQKMQDHPDTLFELSRIENCRNHLIANDFNEEDLADNILVI